MKPHNPAGLTEAQYGRDQGFRLLDEDEIIRDSYESIVDLDYLNIDGDWVDNSCGHAKAATYRTKLSREALAAERGLTPASEPGKADGVDVWMAGVDNRGINHGNLAAIKGDLRAAFLAGQRHERKEICFLLRRLASDDEFRETRERLESYNRYYAIADFLASREPKGDQP